MKKSITILMFLCGLQIHAQSAHFHYKYKLNNVTNLAEAKDITDPMRYYFNTYPTFKDTTDYFEFNSNVNSSQTQLADLLSTYGYTISDFIKETNDVQGTFTSTVAPIEK